MPPILSMAGAKRGQRAFEDRLFKAAWREAVPGRAHGQAAALAQLRKQPVFRHSSQRQQQRIGFCGVFELRRKDVAEVDHALACGMETEVVLYADFRACKPRKVLVARVLVQSLPG